MFYSQIILAKKGPLGKVWMAAHWGDKKLGRPAVFAIDISKSVDSIVHPAVPLALRVSGHLLLGVVRIYSRKVRYLMTDCTEAMVKMKMAWGSNAAGQPRLQATDENGETVAIDMQQPSRRSTRASAAEGGLVPHFGEYKEVALLDPGSAAALFHPSADLFIPAELMREGPDGDYDEEDWIPAELVPEQEPDSQEAVWNPQARPTQEEGTVDSMQPMSVDATLQSLLQHQEEEQWTEFDPEAEAEEAARAGSKKPDEKEEDGEPPLTQPPEDDESKAAEGDAKMAEDDQSKATEASHVSEIELTRAAKPNDSMASDVTGQRASLLDSTKDAASTVAAALQEDEEDFPVLPDDEPMLPFDDEDQQPAMTTESDNEEARPEQAIQLDLSVSRDEESNRERAVSVGSEVELRQEEDAATTTGSRTPRPRRRPSLLTPAEGSLKSATPKPKTKKRKSSTGPPAKRRKRRKVVVDNDATELTNAHIRDMLQDTSDLVRQDWVHPATWIPGQENAALPDPDEVALAAYLSYEQQFCRPGLAKDGHLHPKLVRVWQRNMAPVRGKPFGYELLPEEEEEVPRAAEEGSPPHVDDGQSVPPVAEEEGRENEEESVAQKHEASVQEEQEETSDVELARAREDSMEEGGAAAMQTSDAEDVPLPPLDANEEEEMPPPMDDDDFPPPMDEEEDMPAPMDQSGEEQQTTAEKSPEPVLEGTLDLGMVNDMEHDFQGGEGDDPRQEQGDELVSSTAKWHKHTIKVFSLLKRNMRGPNDSASTKPTELHYNRLVKGCSRRTATQVFFELLQLKTWDYIDVGQDESYGDILISPGTKFGEDPPATR